jgi:hypothetical protein
MAWKVRDWMGQIGPQTIIDCNPTTTNGLSLLLLSLLSNYQAALVVTGCDWSAVGKRQSHARCTVFGGLSSAVFPTHPTPINVSVKPEKLTQQTDGRNRQGTQVLVNQQEETQTRAQRVIIRRRKDVRVPYL